MPPESLPPIFLSYHSGDREIAAWIYERLTAFQFKVWFDQKSISPGKTWLDEIERGLRESDVFIVLLTDHAPRGWVYAEVGAAIRRHYNDPLRHFRIVPLLAARPGSSPPSSLGDFLEAFQKYSLELERDRKTVHQDSFAHLLTVLNDSSSGSPRLVDKPYVGLESFGLDQSHLFFGRDAAIAELLARMQEQRHRWLQVTGASGSGKSSLVKAGLVPALRRRLRGRDDSKTDWAVLLMRPAHDPVQQLAEAWRAWEIEERTEPPGSSGEARRSAIEEALKHPEGLRRLVAEANQRNRALPDRLLDSWQFLLVVDQFEEIFTLAGAPTAGTQRHFARLVEAVLDNPDCPIWLVTTIRSDFQHHLQNDPAWSFALNRTESYAVAPFDPEGLRSAIVQPLRMAGGRLEDADPAQDPLVNKLLRETAECSGGLSLLSHVLSELWKKAREDGPVPVLRLTHLEALGGFEGAISSSADRVLELLDDGQRQTSRRILLDLVQVGRGSRDVRKTMLKSQIVGAKGAHAENLLAYLAGGRLAGAAASRGSDHPRLIVVREADDGAVTVDLVHETLLEQWGTLRRWIDQYRKDLERQDDIESAAGTWNAMGRSDKTLPGAGLLEHYSNWEQEPLSLSDVSTSYLDRASRYHLSRRRIRYLVTAVSMTLALGCALLAGVAFVMMGRADGQAQRANEERDRANKNEGEARAASVQMREVTHATLLDSALQATLNNDLEQASRWLGRIRSELPAEYHEDPDTRYVAGMVQRRTPVALAADQDLAGKFEDARINQDGTVVSVVHRFDQPVDSECTRLETYNSTSGKKLLSFALNRKFLNYQFSRDGSTCAAVRDYSSINVYQTASGVLLREIDLHLDYPDSIYNFSYSSDGKRISVITQRGKLYKIDLTTGASAKPTAIPWDLSSTRYFRFNTSGVGIGDERVMFSRENDMYGGIVQLPCYIVDSEIGKTDQDEFPEFYRIVFTDDRKCSLELVEGKTQKVLRTIKPLFADKEAACNVTVAASARLVAFDNLAEDGGREIEAYTFEGRLTRRLSLPPNSLLGRLTPQGLLPTWSIQKDRALIAIENLAGETAKSNYTLPLPARVVRPLEGDTAEVALTDIDINKPGDMALLIYSDKTVDLWDLKRRMLVSTRSYADAAITFSDSGEKILIRSDRSAKVADARMGVQIAFLPDDESITCWSLSKGGDRLITGHQDGKARIWNTRTGSMICETSGSLNPILDIAVVADGKQIVGWDGESIRQWDLASGAALSERRYFTPDSRIPVAALVGPSYLAVQDRDSGETSRPLLRLAPDGNSLVILTGKRLQVLDANSLQTLLDEEREERYESLNADPVGTIVFFTRPGEMGQSASTLFWDTWQRSMIFESNYEYLPTTIARVGKTGPIAIADDSGRVAFFSSVPMRNRILLPGISNAKTLSFGRGGAVLTVQTDYGLTIWDIGNGSIVDDAKPLLSIRADEAAVNASGSTALVWLNISRTLSAWNLSSGEEMCSFANINKPSIIKNLGIDSTHFLMSYQDRRGDQIEVWDYKTMAQFDIRSAKKHQVNGTLNPSNTVFNVSFSKSGDRLLLADVNYAATNWNIEGEGFGAAKVSHNGPFSRAKPGVPKEPGHLGLVLGLAVRPDGRHYATTGLDNHVHVWRVDPPQHEFELIPAKPLNGTYRYAIAYHPSGRFLVLSDNRDNDADWINRTPTTKTPQSIRVFEADTGRDLGSFAGHGDVIWSLAFNADGSKLVSCGQDGAIKVWDFESHTESFTIPDAHRNWALCAKFTPDGKRIVSGGKEDNALKIWNVETRQLERSLSGHLGSVTKICLSENGDRAFTACGDGKVRIWNLHTGVLKLVLAGHNGPIWGLDVFSRGGKATRLVSSGEDGTVRLWPLDLSK